MFQSQDFYSAMAFIKALKCRGSESGLLENLGQGLDVYLFSAHMQNPSFFKPDRLRYIHTYIVNAQYCYRS